MFEYSYYTRYSYVSLNWSPNSLSIEFAGRDATGDARDDAQVGAAGGPQLDGVRRARRLPLRHDAHVPGGRVPVRAGLRHRLGLRLLRVRSASAPQYSLAPGSSSSHSLLSLSPSCSFMSLSIFHEVNRTFLNVHVEALVLGFTPEYFIYTVLYCIVRVLLNSNY